MAFNGFTKKLGLWVTIGGIIVVCIGGYAVMGYQVGDHETRITTIEDDDKTFQVKYTEQMTRVEERQRNMTDNISDIKDGIDTILRRGGGAGP